MTNKFYVVNGEEMYEVKSLDDAMNCIIGYYEEGVSLYRLHIDEVEDKILTGRYHMEMIPGFIKEEIGKERH